MPSYNIRDKRTGKVTLMEMKISEMEQMLKDDTNLECLILKAPPYADPFQLGRMKPSTQFKERIDKIKRQNKGNNISGTLV